MASINLKAKTKKSAIWTVGSKIGAHAVNLIFTAILARLVLPESYGIYGTFTIIVTLSEAVIRPFINKNLILEDENSRILTASYFVSFIHSAILATLWWIGADFLASFFDQNELIALMKYGGVVLFMSSFANPLMSLLEKRIDFKWISISDFTASVLGRGVFAVVLAYYGLEYWALFGGFLLYNILSLVMYAIKARPLFEPFGYKDIKKIYEDSIEMIMGNFANMSAQKGDFFIITKFLGAEALGFYSKAFKLMVLPTTLISSAFQKIAFPVLTSVNDDKEKIKSFYLKLIYLSSLMLFPLTVILYFLADLIVDILLGSQWTAVVAPFQVLLFAIYFRFAYKIGGIVLSVLREFRLLMYNQLLYATLIIGSSLLFKDYGITGVATGVTIAIIINYIVLHSLAMSKIGISLFEHVKETKYSILISIFEVLVFLSIQFVFYGVLLIIAKVVVSVTIIFVLVYYFVKKPQVFGENGLWWFNYITPKK